MVMNFKIDIYGDEVINRRLLKFEAKPRNLGGAYDVLKEEFFGFEREQFDSEGASGSGGWAALKPATIRAKAAKGESTKILQATTEMFESFTDEMSSDWAGHYTADEMFFGSSDSKAKFHQRGTDKMPQRRPVELSEPQRRKMIKTFQMWLVDDDKLDALLADGAE